MHRASSTRYFKNSTSTAKTAYRHFDRAGSSFGRWITTDHSGLSQSLLDMPWMSFKDTLYFLAMRFLIAVVGAVLSGLMVFLLIAYGIPALLQAMLT